MNSDIKNGIRLSVEEAIARLADGETIETRLEVMPNDGITEVNQEPRNWCIERIRKNTPFESGAIAQSMDLGVHVHVVVQTGKLKRVGRLFFKTKPECRLTPEQLAESLARRHGADIFSKSYERKTA